MSFVGTLQKNSKDPIYLVTGVDHTGREAWYYVLVTGSKFRLFKEALSNGNLHLTDYGKILESGYGAQPPDDVIARVKKRYDL